MNKFFQAVIAGTLIGWLGVASADDTQELDVEAQPLSNSLRQVAEEFDLKIAFYSNSTNGLEAPALAGTYTPDEALDTLLADTRLEYTYVNDSSVAVRPIAAVAEDSSTGKSQPASSLVLMAQNQTSATQNQTSPTTNQKNENKAPPVLEEIIVTGSNIRGAAAVGVDVITIDRSYIETSGIATTTELIQSVPQNVGIANEAVEAEGIVSGSGRNQGFASGVSLRGLGTDSTLVLVNGRRSASGGSAGNIVDLNSIPTAAVERIEVLADGASAIYGSDAVGGVVNVILRDDYEGAETSVRYAPGTSDIDEIQVSQVFGKKWDTGNALFTYEFYDRSELKSADRIYTRDSDLTSLGGDDESSRGSNPGNIDRYIAPDGSRTNGAWAIPEGQDGTSLTPGDLLVGVTNLQNTREGSDVLPSQKRQSIYVSARQELSDNIELFGEARYSAREFDRRARLSITSTLTVPNTNPFFVDAVGGSDSLRIRYSSVDDYGAPRSSGDVDTIGGVLGASFALSDSWELEVYGSHGSEDTVRNLTNRLNNALVVAALADPDPATAFNPFGDGSFTNPATLAAVEGFSRESYKSELTTVDARIEGDLFEMAGGAAKLVVGAQYRDQSLVGDLVSFTTTPTPVPGSLTGIYNLKRDVTAAFAEIYLPIVSDQNSRPGIQALTVSLAGRYEDYSDFGDTFDPKLGISWSPVESFKVRGTVGTSFRAPLLTELNTESNNVILRNRIDPASPTGRTLALTLSGNSPDIIPQEGASWTAGFDITPTSIQGLKIGVTYFETDVDELIARPIGAAAAVFLEPEVNAPVITRCPCDIATINALLNDPGFIDIGTPIDPDQLAIDGAIVDSRIQNVAKAKISGLDLSIAYAFETSVGDFNLSFYASHVSEFTRQLLNAPAVDKVDTVAHPNSLNLRSGLSWTSGGLNAAVIARHIGNYEDDLGSIACSQDPCSVDSWTTWDIQLGYDFGDNSGFLDGTKLRLSVRNVFDNDPPFVFNSFSDVGFDAINADPLGRFAAVQLTKSW